jgi:protocatechuate 3,4-dioxygenase beta subunit
VKRRTFLRSSAAVPLTLLVGCGGEDDEPSPSAPTTARTLPATPTCVDGGEPTVEQTEGPYFSPGSPERRTIVTTGMRGTPLVLAGLVLTTSCRPVDRALLDFWQADDAGEYDNAGFTLRGHQFTDARGRYRLETIVPGIYTGRTRHIHVKVQAPDSPVLTTQLYFPGEEDNARDGIYVPELEMDVSRSTSRRVNGVFQFVLDV